MIKKMTILGIDRKPVTRKRVSLTGDQLQADIGEPIVLTVCGCNGLWCYHKEYVHKGASTRWCITHYPTTAIVCRVRTRAAAKHICQQLTSINWLGVPNICSCNPRIVRNAIPTVYRDWLLDSSDESSIANILPIPAMPTIFVR